VTAITGWSFERCLVVDWSAARPPNRGADSIWIADLPIGAGEPTLVNPAGPVEAMEVLSSIVTGADGRIVIGFDFCFGAVRGFGRFLGPGAEPPWRRLWRHCAAHLSADLSDKWALVEGLNAMVGSEPGPFWGLPSLPRRPARVAGGLATWRRCEDVARAAGWRPKSVWQVAYAGSVGLQSLTGMAFLDRFVAAHGAVVWPFDTGLAPPAGPGRILVAEIYPTMFPQVGGHAVKDARQVHGTVQALADAAVSGALAGWLRPAVPASHVPDVVDEEGWVLGVSGGATTTATAPPTAPGPGRPGAGRSAPARPAP
jgi:hypothetical protein